MKYLIIEHDDNGIINESDIRIEEYSGTNDQNYWEMMGDEHVHAAVPLIWVEHAINKEVLKNRSIKEQN